jgi:hypothetical protein
MATTGKKGGSKMIWIIGGLIVIAGGIGAYFLLRKPKEDKGSGETDTNTDTNTDTKDVNSNLGSGSGTKTYTAPSELSDSTKIKAFQDWMDAQGKGWVLKDGKYVLLNKGAGYGNYGKSTDAVWKVYGKDYLKSLTTSTSDKPTSDKPASDLSKDIDTIIGFSTGTIAEKSYLQKTNADFVSTWAKAISNKKRAFVWANQVYRTKTGVKVLEYNPIGLKYYANIGGSISKTSPDDSASAYFVAKGTDLGKAKNVDYNNGLWLYLPDSGVIYKWYKINYLSKTKPSSSFNGITDEIEFANFDNNLDLNL